MIAMWYFIIGLIYALATCLKYLDMMNGLNDTQKILAKMEGHFHWATFLVIFLTRFLLWPVYIVGTLIK